MKAKSFCECTMSMSSKATEVNSISFLLALIRFSMACLDSWAFRLHMTSILTLTLFVTFARSICAVFAFCDHPFILLIQDFKGIDGLLLNSGVGGSL